MRTPHEACQQTAPKWNRLIGALAIGAVLLHVIVGAAFNDPHLVEAVHKVRHATVRPVFVPRSISIYLPHHGDNRETPTQQSVQFITTDWLIGEDGRVPGFGITRRHIGWKDGFISTGNELGKFVLEPSIRLLEGVVSKKDFPRPSRLDSRRLSVIANAEINHDSLVREESTVRRVGHDVRPLVLAKLDLSGLPLKVSDDRATNSSGGHEGRQEGHQLSGALNAFLKAGYVLLLLSVAVAILTYAHRQLFSKWNLRALLRLLLMYMLAGAIIFHVVSLPSPGS